jgi:hypothetical protein
MSKTDRVQVAGVEISQESDALNISTGLTATEALGVVSITSEAAISETFTTGTVTLSPRGTSVLNAVGAITATLPSGTYIGQIKVITMQTNATGSTVSITNHQTSDPEVATFDAIDETGVFMWTGTEWITIFATCTFL